MVFARVQTIFLLSCFHIAAASLLPTGVIFPLYIYPDGNCSVWSELLDSIAEYDTLPFYVIINPSSGPGDENSQPDASYQTCIAELLNTGSNVHAVGYVLTDYGSRSEQDVLADIATYAQWDSDYRPSGIFFDQASYSASEVSTYTTYAENARSSFSDALVILNPGTATDSGYYAIADLIVTTENDYDSFSISDINITTSTPASQQIVILLSAPSSLPTSMLSELVDAGIAATFITNYPSDEAYENFPSYWDSFVEDLVTLQS